MTTPASQREIELIALRRIAEIWAPYALCSYADGMPREHHEELKSLYAAIGWHEMQAPEDAVLPCWESFDPQMRGACLRDGTNHA